MAKDTDKVELTPGTITLTDSHGRKTATSIASLLSAADIPVGLTYTQVGAITTLANLVVVLIRTLIARDILDEQFMEDNDYDLAAIVQTIEDMGGDYGEPDLTVT
ncbi:hypothetical protein LCGC14_2772410 [marine sediment metagenome]|uniref:Uncharacterized protein n=1 Tax=marine sediment metagenome TaxID=412755 RepID=A0A0F8ZHL6_9ZZZZ